MVENQFMQCFIKESKHAYKNFIKWGAIVISALVSILLIVTLFQIFSPYAINIIYMIFAGIGFVCGLGWEITLNYLTWIPWWAYALSIIIMSPMYYSYSICLARAMTDSHKNIFRKMGGVCSIIFVFVGCSSAIISFFVGGFPPLASGVIIILIGLLICAALPTNRDGDLYY